MIHPDYNENLNYPDLAVLEIDIKYHLTDELKLILKAQQSLQFEAQYAYDR